MGQDCYVKDHYLFFPVPTRNKGTWDSPFIRKVYHLCFIPKGCISQMPLGPSLIFKEKN